MINKIIQKEKERQDNFLKPMKEYNVIIAIEIHKNSLINLKEYMEGLIDRDKGCVYLDGCNTCDSNFKHSLEFYSQLKEDIEELTKMIERYE